MGLENWQKWACAGVAGGLGAGLTVELLRRRARRRLAASQHALKRECPGRQHSPDAHPAAKKAPEAPVRAPSKKRAGNDTDRVKIDMEVEDLGPMEACPTQCNCGSKRTNSKESASVSAPRPRQVTPLVYA